MGDESSAFNELFNSSSLAPSKWADIITVSPLSSPDIFKVFRELRKKGKGKNGKLSALLIAEYGLEEKCFELGEKNSDIVVGFVASKPLDNHRLVYRNCTSPCVVYKVSGGGGHFSTTNGSCSVPNGDSQLGEMAGDPSIVLLHTVKYSSMRGQSGDAN